jgi:hypothetical protein
VFAPRVTNRSSPSAESSSIVTAKGSLRTPSPSARETPCFLIFAASFFGSKVAVTRLVYAYNAYVATRLENTRCSGVLKANAKAKGRGGLCRVPLKRFVRHFQF